MLPFDIDYFGREIFNVSKGTDPFLIVDYYNKLLKKVNNQQLNNQQLNINNQQLNNQQLNHQQLIVIANTNQHAEYLYSIVGQLTNKDLVHFCPDWGTLAYDQYNPSAQIVSERIKFLHCLGSKVPGIYIISLPTALHKLSPVDYIINNTNFFVGQNLDQKQTIDLLIRTGYRQVEVVYEHGEFSVVGNNLEFFPSGSIYPYRIGYFEGQIERIRYFNSESHEILGDVESINIQHGSEYPIDNNAIKTFVNNWSKYFESVTYEANSIFGLINERIIPQGSQYYLPLFFTQPLSTIVDYIDENVALVNYQGYQDFALAFEQENQLRYKERSDSKRWPPLKTSELYISANDLFAQAIIKGAKLLTFNESNYHESSTKQKSSTLSKRSAKFANLIDLQPDYLQNSIFSTQNLENNLDNNQNNSQNNNQENKNQSADESWLQKAVFLGNNEDGLPITGENTFNSLSGNKYTFRELFAPEISQNHQYYKLVNYLRKVRANFKRIELVITVSSSARTITFTDMLEDIPLSFSTDKSNSSLKQQFENFFASNDKRLLAKGAQFNSYAQEENSGLNIKSPGIHARYIVCNLKTGFAYFNEIRDIAYIVISEQDIIGSYLSRSRSIARTKQKQAQQVIQGLMEIHEGQLLVHQQHGICRYLGLKTMELNPGVAEDFLDLEFADTNLLIPVSNINEVSVYSHQVLIDVDRKMLSHISGARAKQWLRKREDAIASIRDMAAELLEIESKRSLEQSFVYTLFEKEYNEFCSYFRYQETPDQYATIQSIIEDMCSNKKMERLICGDVGFGKTEVAMRAAFIAITNSKQVAILVPTTLLAQQHYESFKDRFAYTGAVVELVSSFNTKAKNEEILKRLKAGLIDIVIGTHAIIADKVKFKDLGLLVIDEEHQFGVKQKEKIKKIKANVDVLTMTATPIPRTLNMALNGFRDISLITTAPSNRLNIITQLIAKDDENTIKDAINREIMRGGQVFFIHNDVMTMPNVVDHLQQLIPHARITYANGQMDRNQLEDAMIGFHNQRFNILVCSTIVETGIDVPNANTIIINNAQNFGMAQLHQLRGRVGRSFRQAYAYFIAPNMSVLNEDSKLRLSAMIEIDSLGAGYILATHDLEIRGAGEILGEQQSGKVDSIGYNLYMTMLKSAIKQMRLNQEITPESLIDKQVDINIGIPTIIPASYIQAPNIRVYFYQQISNASDELQLDRIANNMIARFSDLPPSVRALFMLTKLKLRVRNSGISKIHGNYRQIIISFDNFDYANSDKMLEIIINQPNDYGHSANQFVIKNLDKDPFECIKQLNKTLKQILDFDKLKQVQLEDYDSQPIKIAKSKEQVEDLQQSNQEWSNQVSNQERKLEDNPNGIINNISKITNNSITHNSIIAGNVDRYDVERDRERDEEVNLNTLSNTLTPIAEDEVQVSTARTKAKLFASQQNKGQEELLNLKSHQSKEKSKQEPVSPLSKPLSIESFIQKHHSASTHNKINNNNINNKINNNEAKDNHLNHDLNSNISDDGNKTIDVTPQKHNQEFKQGSSKLKDSVNDLDVQQVFKHNIRQIKQLRELLIEAKFAGNADSLLDISNEQINKASIEQLILWLNLPELEQKLVISIASIIEEKRFRSYNQSIKAIEKFKKTMDVNLDSQQIEFEIALSQQQLDDLEDQLLNDDDSLSSVRKRQETRYITNKLAYYRNIERAIKHPQEISSNENNLESKKFTDKAVDVQEPVHKENKNQAHKNKISKNKVSKTDIANKEIQLKTNILPQESSKDKTSKKSPQFTEKPATQNTSKSKDLKSMLSSWKKSKK